MSVAVYLKNNLKNIPPGIGLLINHIPYSIRPGLGSVYRKRSKEITAFNSFSITEKKAFILTKMKAITNYAYENISFYKDFYDAQGFAPQKLNIFNDLKEIPIIDKSILNGHTLEQRSVRTKGRYVVNTGGSSGTPFSLYIEPSSMGHEWAHMHHIWRKLGYKPSDLKIVFGGRSDLKELIEYDVVRNHFSIDIYAKYKLVSQELKKIIKRFKIKYLHGYPSSIYDFAVYCETEDRELQDLLSSCLSGVFLGSEYPHQHYRDKIEKTFNVETISWYGHTERAVLAYEKEERFRYEPFGTYGFAESLKIDEENHQLISTSYYNFASPLIRYNTQDIISNIELNEGILKSFKIKKGREGEFIIDKNNKKINLTGLIFGRHHQMFNHSKFIQVKQPMIGKIEIHYVSNFLTNENVSELFDQRNLDLAITFVKRDEPYRTDSGKVNLLIKE